MTTPPPPPSDELPRPPSTNETKHRKPGCKCHWEEGDSPCPVHGEDEGKADPNG